MKVKKKVIDELRETLNSEFPNETQEHIERLLSDFAYDCKQTEYECGSIDELKWDLIDFAKDWLLTQSADTSDEIDNQKGEMTVQETVFCEEYLKTFNASAAYAASHKHATLNPDSVRSLASRFMRRPHVTAFIQATLGRISQSAFEFGIWSRTQSLLARKDMLLALKSDIEKRKQRLQDVIESIQNDETLGNADKAQRIVQATQRPIYGRDTVEAFNTLCNGLDSLTWTNDWSKVAWYSIDNEANNTWENEQAHKKAVEQSKSEMDEVMKALFQAKAQSK